MAGNNFLTKKCSPRILDVLGERASMNFATQQGDFQTTCGGVISIIFAVLLFPYLSYTLSQYYKSDSPIITSSTTTISSDSVSYDLYNDDLIMPLALTLPGSQLITDTSKYATVKGFIIKKITHSTGSVTRTILHNYDYKKCSVVNDIRFNGLIQLIVDYPGIHNHMLCPDIQGIQSYFNISKNLAKNEQIYYTIRVYPCSLADQASCLPGSSIDQVTAVYASSNKVLKSKNYTKPMERVIRSYEEKLNRFQTKRAFYGVAMSQLLDDVMEVGPPKETQVYTTLQFSHLDTSQRAAAGGYCTVDQINAFDGSCEEFLVIDLKVRAEIMVIRRNYRKMAGYLGEIGGNFTLVVTFLMIIYSLDYKKVMKSYILEHMFHVGRQRLAHYQSYFRGRDDKKDIQNTSLQNLDKVLEDEGSPEEELAKFEGVGPKTISLEILKSRRLVNDLVDKLNFIEMLETLMIEDFHKTLIPILILKFRQQELREQKILRSQGQWGKGASNDKMSAYSSKLVVSNYNAELKKSRREGRLTSIGQSVSKLPGAYDDVTAPSMNTRPLKESLPLGDIFMTEEYRNLLPEETDEEFLLIIKRYMRSKLNESSTFETAMEKIEQSRRSQNTHQFKKFNSKMELRRPASLIMDDKVVMGSSGLHSGPEKDSYQSQSEASEEEGPEKADSILGQGSKTSGGKRQPELPIPDPNIFRVNSPLRKATGAPGKPKFSQLQSHMRRASSPRKMSRMKLSGGLKSFNTSSSAGKQFGSAKSIFSKGKPEK